MDYFVSKNGQTQDGPFTLEEVKEKIGLNELPSGALFWRQGLEGWVQANRIPEFKEFLESLPPPLDDTTETETPPPLSAPEKSKKDAPVSSNGSHPNESRRDDGTAKKKPRKAKAVYKYDEDGTYKFISNAFLPTAEFVGKDFGFIALYRVVIFGVPLSLLLWLVLGKPEHLPEIGFALIPTAPIVLSTVFKRARGLMGTMFGWVAVVAVSFALYLGGPILVGLFLLYLRFARPNSLDKGGYHCLKESLDINAWTSESDRKVLLQLMRKEDSFRRENGIPHQVALAPYRVGLHDELKERNPVTERGVFSWMFSTNGSLRDGHSWKGCTAEDKRAAEKFTDGYEDLKRDLTRLKDCLSSGRFLIEKNAVEYEVRDLDGVLKFLGLESDELTERIDSIKTRNEFVINGWHCRRAD